MIDSIRQLIEKELKSPDEAMSAWEKPKAVKSEINVRVNFLIIS